MPKPANKLPTVWVYDKFKERNVKMNETAYKIAVAEGKAFLRYEVISRQEGNATKFEEEIARKEDKIQAAIYRNDLKGDRQRERDANKIVVNTNNSYTTVEEADKYFNDMEKTVKKMDQIAEDFKKELETKSVDWQSLPWRKAKEHVKEVTGTNPKSWDHAKELMNSGTR